MRLSSFHQRRASPPEPASNRLLTGPWCRVVVEAVPNMGIQGANSLVCHPHGGRADYPRAEPPENCEPSMPRRRLLQPGTITHEVDSSYDTGRMNRSSNASIRDASAGMRDRLDGPNS